MEVGLPAPGCIHNFGCTITVKRYGLKMGSNGAYKSITFRCAASRGRGFGKERDNKEKSKNTKRQKDVASEPSKMTPGDPKNRSQMPLDLRSRGDKKSSNVILDKQFLDKVEAVQRSALEKKKAEKNKVYQAIDYDAPIESDKSTIGFGTKWPTLLSSIMVVKTRIGDKASG